MAEDVLVRFKLQYDQVVAGTNAIVKQFDTIAKALVSLGRGDEAKKFITDARTMAKEIKGVAGSVDQLIKNIAVLQAAEAKFKPGAKTIGRERVGPAAGFLIHPEEGAPDRFTREQVIQARLAQEKDLRTLISAGQKKELEGIRRVEAAYAEIPQIQAELIAQAAERHLLEQRIARIVSGRAIEGVQDRRLSLLDEKLKTLNENEVKLEQSALGQTGRAGDRVNRVRDQQTEAHRRAQEDLVRIQGQIDSQIKKIANSENASHKQRMVNATEYQKLLVKRKDAERREFAASELLKSPIAKTDFAVELGGAKDTLSKVREEAAETQQQLLDMGGGVKSFAPDLVEAAANVTILNRQFAAATQRADQLAAKVLNTKDGSKANLKAQQELLVAEEERLRIQEQLVQSALKFEGIERADPAARDIEPAESFADLRAKDLAQLPRLEQTFISAFDDMGRRFQATLQFAISGALIFGIQQGIRKFIETGIEVQRAFQDIGTAFEFDIDFKRGSSAFESQLNVLRIQILGLADEFNVLPTEANKAAFSMVSRFSDSADALKALRAQLLATKVSTIDQGEALRALSAVAENFSAASLFIADGLTIQEKLFAREREAVDNYGKALDIAVHIQQRFGVEVEDVLEGVARLSPTFSQLGFSMEQTSAIVAAVSRELGQTGANAAERLNRSIGQLTEPSIRDSLLELAARTNGLNLTMADFKTGETALRALISQFHQLEQIDPQAAFQLLNVLGQRRELEVVAALFNTTELQDAMEQSLGEAAGAAEKRFSFLATTISERLASIASGFERLAQNFERLGLLGPLEVAVATLDEFLKLVNKALEAVTRLVDGMGFLGDAIRTTLVAGTAIAALTRVAGLIANVTAFSAGALATRAAASPVVGAVAGAGLANALTGVSEAFVRMKQDMTGNRIGLRAMGRGFREAGVALGSFVSRFLAVSVTNAFAKGIGVLAKLFPETALKLTNWSHRLVESGSSVAIFAKQVAVAGGGVLVMAAAAFGAFKLFEQMGQFAGSIGNALTRAETRVRISEARGDVTFETPEARDLAVANAALEEFQQLEPTVTNVFADIFSTVEKFFRGGIANPRNFVGAVGDEFEDLFELALENAGGRLSGQDIKRLMGLDVGSQPFIDELQLQGQRAAVRAAVRNMLVNAINEGAAEAGAGAFGQIPGTAEADLGRPLLEGLQAVERQILSMGIGESNDSLLTAFGQVEESYAEFMEQQGAGLRGIELSLSLIREQIGTAKRSLQLGFIDENRFLEIVQQGIDDAKAAARDLSGDSSPGAREQMIAALEEAAGLEAVFLETLLARFQRDRSRAALNTNSGTRLRAEISILTAELRALRQRGSQADVEAKLIELQAAQQQLADFYRERALTIASRRVGLARTEAEWFDAQQDYIDELERQAILAIATDWDKVKDLTDQAQAEENTLFDRETDNLRRMALVASRLNGPINDKIAILAGQIAAIDIQIDREPDALKQQELIVEKKELMAQVLQEELSRMEAFIRAQVGVRDTISLLKGQIVIANQEIAITAQIFGELSSEFNNAKANLDSLKNELADALLSLDDINRRLGSDLSNDFEQAILDLHAIAEKLQAPNLGDLEEAQLLLEKQRGEMQAERAFFSTELFNLQFLSETGQLGQGAYLNALESLLAQVDTTTQQGKSIFLEIQSLIDGMTEDISDMAFNVPTSIRLPTIFEVRRALAADQLGVSYMDNRTLDIMINVQDATDVEALVSALANTLGGSGITSTAGRFAPGASSLTLGGF